MGTILIQISTFIELKAFFLKFFTGILVIWIHEHVYRMDDFSHDGQRFLREGEYLYNVFSVSVTDYFKLLTGIGETPGLIEKYLHRHRSTYHTAKARPLITK